MSGATIGRAILGMAVSVIAIVLVLGSVDLTRTLDVLAAAAPAWVLALAALVCLDLAIRSLRWQRLLAPIRQVAYRSVAGYLLVGYLANNVLPARLGELVRSHFLGDREGISRTTTLGTVVVERVVDTAMVVAIAAGAIIVLNVRGVVTNAVIIGAAVAGLLLVALSIGVAAHRLPGGAAAIRFVERWPRVAQAVERLRSGLGVAGRPRTLVQVVALSGLAWATSSLAFAAAGQAVGLELRLGEALLIASGVALASAVPSGPGYLGTFELAALKIAEALGKPGEQAFALALLAHVTILVITSAGGLVVLNRIGWQRRAEPATAEGAGQG